MILFDYRAGAYRTEKMKPYDRKIALALLRRSYMPPNEETISEKRREDKGNESENENVNQDILPTEDFPLSQNPSSSQPQVCSQFSQVPSLSGSQSSPLQPHFFSQPFQRPTFKKKQARRIPLLVCHRETSEQNMRRVRIAVGSYF